VVRAVKDPGSSQLLSDLVSHTDAGMTLFSMPVDRCAGDRLWSAGRAADGAGGGAGQLPPAGARRGAGAVPLRARGCRPRRPVILHRRRAGCGPKAWERRHEPWRARSGIADGGRR
jgi:hypothetical protein